MKQGWTWPRVELSDGAVEAMKWLGLILMTADHAQKYGLIPAVPGVYEAGRVVFRGGPGNPDSVVSGSLA